MAQYSNGYYSGGSTTTASPYDPNAGGMTYGFPQAGANRDMPVMTGFDPNAPTIAPQFATQGGGGFDDGPGGSWQVPGDGSPWTPIQNPPDYSGGGGGGSTGGVNQTDTSGWAWQPNGTPYRDPNTGQCYVYQNGVPQKAQDGACGGTMQHPDTGTKPGALGPPGTLPPGSPDPGDGPVTGPGGSTDGSIPSSFQPNTPPPIPGSMPNVDPYEIGSSPDFSDLYGLDGVSPVNPQANPFDYGQVSDFADAAYAQSMRYLQPQFDTEDRRYEQALINKGIDPNSEAGMEMLRRKEVGQNDQLSRAAFDALGFGADLQGQMFDQSATRSGYANDLLQALMGLDQRGHEFDTTAGLNANQQAFAQMLALEGLDYRDYMTLIDQMRYDDSLALSLLGMGAPPGYTTVNTGLSQGPGYDLQGALDMWNTPLFGS